MTKFFNVFDSLSDYQAYKESSGYTQPNVVFIKEINKTLYDYGDNKPRLKVGVEPISNGGETYSKGAITSMDYYYEGVTSLDGEFAYANFQTIDLGQIPSSLTSLKHAFLGCKNLIEVHGIKDGILSMYGTFYYCTSLVKSPPIPSTVTNVEMTFFECSNLKEVTFLQTTPPSKNEHVFYECRKLETIYVPDEALEDWKTSWSFVASKFKPLSEKPSE